MRDVRHKTSMQDIADALGISKNAVSIALNNKPGISESLRTKVIKTAITMNYGSYGKLSNTFEQNLVAICIPSIISGFSQFYSSIYWAIEKELGLTGYSSLLVSISEEMEKNLTLPTNLLDHEVKGVAVVGVLSEEYVKLLSSVYDHIVIIDNIFLNLSLTSVTTANVEGGYTAVTYLLSEGFKRIGFIGQTYKYASYEGRYEGYVRALKRAGVAFDPSIVFDTPSFFEPQLMTNTILDTLLKEGVDALFCANDRLAIQLISQLHSKGIQIPEDLSIMGFDDLENADIVSPPLTTMHVSREELGSKAANALISHIEGKHDSKLSISIYPTLVKRKSVLNQTK